MVYLLEVLTSDQYILDPLAAAVLSSEPYAHFSVESDVTDSTDDLR